MKISEHIEQIKKDSGINLVLYGTGNPVYEPHILYYPNDGLNSWVGYDIVVMPDGANGKKQYFQHRGLN